jgi:hypothetical protein
LFASERELLRIPVSEKIFDKLNNQPGDAVGVLLSLRRRLAPYPFTPKAGASGALAAAPGKPGFWLAGTQCSGARTKNSVPNLRRFFLAGLPAPSSHNGTSALEDADFLVGCEQVFARIFWRLLRVQKETFVAT